MNKFLLTILLSTMWVFATYAQKGLNIAQFFTDNYRNNTSVTIVEVTSPLEQLTGISVYKSITVNDNKTLSEELEKAVRKDGAGAKSKEVIFKKGKLYFGMYFMGGQGSHRRYLYYLNQRLVGKEKTILIFIEGDIDEEMAESLINNKR